MLSNSIYPTNCSFSRSLLPRLSFRANEVSREIYTLSIPFSAILAKRSLDSASRNYGMLATGKHTIQNRFATLGMTRLFKICKLPNKRELAQHGYEPGEARCVTNTTRQSVPKLSAGTARRTGRWNRVKKQPPFGGCKTYTAWPLRRMVFTTRST